MYYAERHYAECHYAECHYAECRDTLLGPLLLRMALPSFNVFIIVRQCFYDKILTKFKGFVVVS